MANALQGKRIAILAADADLEIRFPRHIRT
jgi:hypothetical protein